jgi:hypothetical protein
LSSFLSSDIYMMFFGNRDASGIWSAKIQRF